MASTLKAREERKEKMEALQSTITSYFISHFPETRSNPTVPISQAESEEKQLLNTVIQMINHHRVDLSAAACGELSKHAVLCYETQVAMRNTERRVREYNTAHVRSRRQFRWRMAIATTDAEKERLRQERKRFIARRWYYNNQAREQAKSKRRTRQKRERGCCPFSMLGIEPPPKKSVFMWITHCKTCERKEYGHFGCDQQGRVGTHFRGEWFEHIDPQTGTGTTFAGEIISLTRIY